MRGRQARSHDFAIDRNRLVLSRVATARSALHIGGMSDQKEAYEIAPKVQPRKAPHTTTRPFWRRRTETLTGTDWQAIATAPRDGSHIVVKRKAARVLPKHTEHVVRWSSRGEERWVWRSYTVTGKFLEDRDLLGWRPMDDGAWEVLARKREHYRLRFRRRKVIHAPRP